MFRMVLVLLATTAAAAVASASQPPLNDSNKVTEIGSYAAGRLGESHTFGYEAQLWRAGKQVVGFFIVSGGTNRDPAVGIVSAVRYSPNSGEIEFDTDVPRDLGEACQHFHFAGRLSHRELVGTLEWTAPPRRGPEPPVESLRLMRSTKALSAFPTYRDWKESANERLKLHGTCQ